MNLFVFFLRLLPRPFRERFGEEVLQLCIDLYHEARTRGHWAVATTLLQCITDLIHTALLERLSEMKKETRFAIVLAVIMGLLLGWFDTHSQTDDTGIIAGFVFLASFSVAVLFPKRPWLVGVLVGLGIPVSYAIAYLIGWLPPVALAKYLECFIAVIPAVLGALLGSGMRHWEDTLTARWRRAK